MDQECLVNSRKRQEQIMLSSVDLFDGQVALRVTQAHIHNSLSIHVRYKVALQTTRK